MPQGMQPGEISIAPGVSLPSGVSLPVGVSLPSGVSLPVGVSLPAGMSLPVGVSLASGVSLPSAVPVQVGVSPPSIVSSEQNGGEKKEPIPPMSTKTEAHTVLRKTPENLKVIRFQVTEPYQVKQLEKDEIIIEKVPVSYPHANSTAHSTPPTTAAISKPSITPHSGTSVTSVPVPVSSSTQSHPLVPSFMATKVGGDLRFPLAPSSFSIIVEKEEEMGAIDKMTKSMEILDEVPIRMLDTTPLEHHALPSQTKHLETVMTTSITPTHTTLSEAPPSAKVPNTDERPSLPMFTPDAKKQGLASSALFRAPPTSEELPQGRTNKEVMSAKMLLSLHHPADDYISSLKPPGTVVSTTTAPMATVPAFQVQATPPIRTKKTPRKQKPVASIPPSKESSPIVAGKAVSLTTNVQPHPQQTDEASHNKKAQTSVGYTPEELLKILDIPASAPKEATPTQPIKKDAKEPAKTSKIESPAKPLKLSPLVRPRALSHSPQENPEDDSDSDSSDSSSGSDSSSENEESTSPERKSVRRTVSTKESSSDSSEEEQEEEEKIKEVTKPQRNREQVKGGRGTAISGHAAIKSGNEPGKGVNSKLKSVKSNTTM